MKNLFIIAACAATLSGTAFPASGQETGSYQHRTSASAVQFISGGIGAGSREAMERLRPKYDLRLTFARPGSGEYLSDVTVDIKDAKGDTVLHEITEGPLFFAKLPQGTYRVVAEFEGITLVKTITLSGEKPRGAVFYFANDRKEARS
ncbi:carboxypeptidase regulatory-like domain-containing protein [Paraburkholderia hospita]|uniref:carboxypeptidase regulatory-like domain-containing protein n=1 Tax=Paraburkholderia hospita TaxID=169430 RepID=UPI001056DEC1|nr:carboxypeptidase regulatory-like domain-containing protein [Paraburkholderia hospita]